MRSRRAAYANSCRAVLSTFLHTVQPWKETQFLARCRELLQRLTNVLAGTFCDLYAVDLSQLHKYNYMIPSSPRRAAVGHGTV